MHVLHVGIIGLGAMGSALARALHSAKGAAGSASTAPTAETAATAVTAAAKANAATAAMKANAATAATAPAVRLVAISSRRRDAAALLSRELGGVAVVTPEAMAAHADLMLLTVGDGELAQLANHPAFGPGVTVVHTSGALDLSVSQGAADRGAAVGSFHPMVSVVRDALTPARFAGAVVAVDAGAAAHAGQDSAAEHTDHPACHAGGVDVDNDKQRARAEHALVHTQLSALASALGMTPLTVTAQHRARWHAAATLVGNSSAALLAHAEHMLRDLPGDAAVRRAALFGLLNSVLQNLAALPAATSLHGGISGPIARGSADIVQRHLAALHTGGEQVAYQHAASLVWLAVAGQLPAESRDALARLLAPVDLT